jgi:hypothetical protein
MAASSLLVTIGIKYVNHVYTTLLKQFNPGALPHLYILTTMANLAEVNGLSNKIIFSKLIAPFGIILNFEVIHKLFFQAYGVVPQLSSVLASMLPMLGMAKLDTYKCAFASGRTKLERPSPFVADSIF